MRRPRQPPPSLSDLEKNPTLKPRNKKKLSLTEFRLEVRGAKGAPIDGVQVHLTGYHLPDFGGEEDGCGHDEEEDEEAEEEELSDEEDLALARLADGSRGALYDSESEDGMISDESSEDDSDDDSESYSESDGESETDDSEVSDSESESEEEDDEKVPSSVIIEELDANDDDKKEGSSSDSESDDESDDDSDDSDGSGDDEPDDEPVATAPAWGGGGEEKDGKDNKRKAAPSPSDAAEAAAAAESDAKKAKTAASAPTTPVPSAAAVDAKKQHQQQQIQQKQKEQQQQQQQQQKLKEQQQLAQKLKEAQQQASSERIRRFDNGFVIETLASSKSATAPLAKAGKRIKVRYVGKLAKNGKVFDQTKGNATFSFRLGVGEVIKGWDRGCEGMRVGDKRRLTVPPQMGYGSSGVRGTIPGNATLVFDVELVGVQ